MNEIFLATIYFLGESKHRAATFPLKIIREKSNHFVYFRANLRPTLFKQGDWLTRLSLIENRNVPGDHLGTSYTVHRVEDVLPVSETLVGQIQSEIEKLELNLD